MSPFEPVDEGCYFASSQERESWTGARVVCEGLGGHLAVITSQQEQDSLATYLNTVYPGRKYLAYIKIRSTHQKSGQHIKNQVNRSILGQQIKIRSIDQKFGQHIKRKTTEIKNVKVKKVNSSKWGQ